MRITVVDDEGCPSCGQPGSPKNTDAAGNLYWQCPSDFDTCPVAYWCPATGDVELKLVPGSVEEAESIARVAAQVHEWTWGKIAISRRIGGGVTECRFVAPEQAVTYAAEGWDIPPLAAQLRALEEGEQIGDAIRAGHGWQVNIGGRIRIYDDPAVAARAVETGRHVKGGRQVVFLQRAMPPAAQAEICRNEHGREHDRQVAICGKCPWCGTERDKP